VTTPKPGPRPTEAEPKVLMKLKSGKQITTTHLLVAAMGVIVPLALVWATETTSPSKATILKTGMTQSDAVMAVARLSGQDTGTVSDAASTRGGWSYSAQVAVPMDRHLLWSIPFGHPVRDMCLTVTDSDVRLHDLDSNVCNDKYDTWWALQDDGSWKEASSDPIDPVDVW